MTSSTTVCRTASAPVASGAALSSMSDIGVESVKNLANPIKLSIYPSAPAKALRPEGFLAADDGAIHDVYAKEFQLEYLSAGGPRLRSAGLPLPGVV